MTTPPPITLIVSVANQAGQLRGILSRLAVGTRLPDEIIIAEDGTQPDTEAVLAETRRAHPDWAIRLHTQPGKGFRKAIILNRAISDAKHDYIVFLDGDCLPHPAFIADHAKLAASGRFVQGRRAYVREPRVPAVLSGEESLLKTFLTGGMHGVAKGLRLPFPITREDASIESTLGCNFAAWKKDLLAVDGLDESYVGWGKEDSDLAARLIHHGLRRRFVRNHAVVYHLDHPIAPRDGLNPNVARLAETLSTRRTRAVKGLSAHAL